MHRVYRPIKKRVFCVNVCMNVYAPTLMIHLHFSKNNNLCALYMQYIILLFFFSSLNFPFKKNSSKNKDQVKRDKNGGFEGSHFVNVFAVRNNKPAFSTPTPPSPTQLSFLLFLYCFLGVLLILLFFFFLFVFIGFW